MLAESMYSWKYKTSQCGQEASTGVEWVLKTLTFTIEKSTRDTREHPAVHYLSPCLAQCWVTSWDIKACIPSKLAVVHLPYPSM